MFFNKVSSQYKVLELCVFTMVSFANIDLGECCSCIIQ